MTGHGHKRRHARIDRIAVVARGDAPELPYETGDVPRYRRDQHSPEPQSQLRAHQRLPLQLPFRSRGATFHRRHDHHRTIELVRRLMRTDRDGGVILVSTRSVAAGSIPLASFARKADAQPQRYAWFVNQPVKVAPSLDGLSPLAGEPLPAGGRSLRQQDPAIRIIFAGDP